MVHLKSGSVQLYSSVVWLTCYSLICYILAVLFSLAINYNYCITGDEGDDMNMNAEYGVCAPGTELTGRWTKDEHDLFLQVQRTLLKNFLQRNFSKTTTAVTTSSTLVRRTRVCTNAS
jgi:hypothetical protein